MIHSLALTVSLVFAGTAVMAQSHPPNHHQGRTHDPNRPHTPMDPAHHAAMHALFHGKWAGTTATSEGNSTKVHLAVARDSRGNLNVTMRADAPLRLGTARTVSTEGNSVQWVQDVAGASCQAQAIVNPATKNDPETMKGRVSCSDGQEIPFALRKVKG